MQYYNIMNQEILSGPVTGFRSAMLTQGHIQTQQYLEPQLGQYKISFY